jgi:ABC-type uncharacterized transport system ATPase subunit
MEDARVQLRAISKSFGAVTALDGVDLDLRHGEVHALIGENGAGKSTLMRVLAGHLKPDDGRVVVASAPSLEGDRRADVGFVEQEGGLIPELSGAENLILADGQNRRMDRRAAAERITALADRFGGRLDPHAAVSTLTVGQRQRLEILIVMACGAGVLILDEPTAALGADEAATLREIIRTFVTDGGSVFYISHKLGEVIELADRITVLRRGAVVGAHARQSVTVSQLAREMVGEDPASTGSTGETSELVHLAIGDRTEPGATHEAEVVCRLVGVATPSPFAGEAALDGLDLEVRAREVVGVAGVVGSGQTTLAEVLAGFTRPRKGQLTIVGDSIAYVPENRHRDAVAMTLSLRDNLLLHGHRRAELQRGPWFRKARVDEFVEGVLNGSNVRHGGASAPLATLSGGNQQRLVVGRELQESPCLVVAHNPFRGLDVRAIQDVKDALLSAAEGGAGVVMISPDLDELRQFAHRIVVLFAGRIVGEIDVDSDAEAVGRLLGGVA